MRDKWQDSTAPAAPERYECNPAMAQWVYNTNNRWSEGISSKTINYKKAQLIYREKYYYPLVQTTPLKQYYI